MSNLFSKHLHLCFFKLKYPTCTATPLSPPHPKHHHHTPSPSPSPSASSSSSTNFTLNHYSSTSSSDTTPAPDFAAAFASQRFFFSSPGHSNSIIPSTPSNLADVSSGTSIPRGGVVVPKYSLNPYVDFRRSMQEMIESRELVIDVRKDWDYLHELLLCYLALNPTHTHKYIIRAFTDLVVDLLSSSEMAEPNHDQQNSFSGVRLRSTDTD